MAIEDEIGEPIYQKVFSYKNKIGLDLDNFCLILMYLFSVSEKFLKLICTQKKEKSRARKLTQFNYDANFYICDENCHNNDLFNPTGKIKSPFAKIISLT